MPMQIKTETCLKCGSCVTACPVEAIMVKSDVVQIDPNECVDCETCARICPADSIDGGPNSYKELKTN